MSLITRLKKSIADSRAEENMKATIEKQAAQIEYLAIMCDVELDDEEEEIHE